MTFAQPFQQAKEFFCTLHHCTHFCFPYGKKARADKVESFRARGKKTQTKTTNQPTKPTQPLAVRDSLFAHQSREVQRA